MPREDKDELIGYKDYTLKPREREEGEEKIEAQFLDVKLTDEERGEVCDAIVDELQEIIDERRELGLEDTWQANEDQYNGVLPKKDFPFEDASNLPVAITPDKCDSVEARLCATTLEVNPMCRVEPTEKGDVDSAKAKEAYGQYKISNILYDFKGQLKDIYHDSVIHGEGYLDNSYSHEEEHRKIIDVYEGKEDLKRFLKDCPDAKERYPQILSQIEKDESVTLDVEYDEEIYNDPKPTYVPIRDFFVLFDKRKDLNKAHLCCKRFILTGNELKQREKNGYYEGIDKLQSYVKGNEEVNLEDFLTSKFTCYEGIYKYAFNSKGDEVEKKYVFTLVYNTVEEESVQQRLLARLIYYPYTHNHSYFLRYPLTRTGDGICMILKDIQAAANTMFNIAVDSALITSVPSFKAKAGAKARIYPELEKGYYPGVVYWLENMGDLEQFVIHPGNLQYLSTLGLTVTEMAERRTGVTFSMSGKESPSDPRAPAQKTALLLKEANLRVGMFISNIQEANKELFFQLFGLWEQFKSKGEAYRILGETGEYTFPTLSRKEMRMRADYTPHGSIEVLTREQEAERGIALFDAFKEEPILHPQINPEGRRYFVEKIFVDSGGGWEKVVQKILISEERLKEMRIEEMKEAFAKMLEEREQKAMVEAVIDRMGQLIEQGVPRQAIEASIAQEFPTGGIGGQAAVAGGQAAEVTP